MKSKMTLKGRIKHNISHNGLTMLVVTFCECAVLDIPVLQLVITNFIFWLVFSVYVAFIECIVEKYIKGEHILDYFTRYVYLLLGMLAPLFICLFVLLQVGTTTNTEIQETNESTVETSIEENLDN